MLMVPKSARAHSIKSRVVPKSAVARERVKREQPAALHVHCLAHCLNLCLQDAGRICSHVRDTLELIVELVKLIKYSPKRSSLFQSLKSGITRYK